MEIRTGNKRPNDDPNNNQPAAKRQDTQPPPFFSQLAQADIILSRVDQFLNNWKFKEALELLNKVLSQPMYSTPKFHLVCKKVECLLQDDDIRAVAGSVPDMEMYISEQDDAKKKANLYCALGKLHLRIFGKYSTLTNFNQAEYCLEKAAGLDSTNSNIKVEAILIKKHTGRKLDSFIRV